MALSPRHHDTSHRPSPGGGLGASNSDRHKSWTPAPRPHRTPGHRGAGPSQVTGTGTGTGEPGVSSRPHAALPLGPRSRVPVPETELRLPPPVSKSGRASWRSPSAEAVVSPPLRGSVTQVATELAGPPAPGQGRTVTQGHPLSREERRASPGGLRRKTALLSPRAGQGPQAPFWGHPELTDSPELRRAAWVPAGTLAWPLGWPTRGPIWLGGRLLRLPGKAWARRARLLDVLGNGSRASLSRQNASPRRPRQPGVWARTSPRGAAVGVGAPGPAPPRL